MNANEPATTASVAAGYEAAMSPPTNTHKVTQETATFGRADAADSFRVRDGYIGLERWVAERNDLSPSVLGAFKPVPRPYYAELTRIERTNGGCDEDESRT